MYWDRFDICAAYHHFIDRWRWGYLNDAIPPGDRQVRDAALKYDAQMHRLKRKWAAQLEGLKYQPGLSDRQLATLTPNAKAIYMGLVRKHLGVHSTRRG